jgi:hypothetical protein
MDLFGTRESRMKVLFGMIKSHLMVVVYDENSQSIEPDSLMMKFLQLLKKDSIDASLLSGGYLGFIKYISDGGFNTRDFIEIGLGESSSIPETPRPLVTSPRSIAPPQGPRSPPRTSSTTQNSVPLPQQRPNSGSSLVRSSHQVGLGAKGRVRDAANKIESPTPSPNSSRSSSNQRAPLQDMNNDGITRNVSDYVLMYQLLSLGFKSGKDECSPTNCPASSLRRRSSAF